MKITSVPAATVTTPAVQITIDDNWQNTYAFNDTGAAQQTVSVFIPAGPAGTTQFFFTLWSPTSTPITYAQANALNNGAGYGNSDLVSAITAYLASITAA